MNKLKVVCAAMVAFGFLYSCTPLPVLEDLKAAVRDNIADPSSAVPPPALGVSWVEEPVGPLAATRRAFHASMVFANKLWVFGGRDENGLSLFTLSSYDGTAWIESVSDMSSVTHRAGGAGTFIAEGPGGLMAWGGEFYDNAMFRSEPQMGLLSYDSTAEGWTEVFGMSPHSSSAQVKYGNYFLSISGATWADDAMTEVESSTQKCFATLPDSALGNDDSENVIGEAEFRGREGHQAIVFKDTLLVIGGQRGMVDIFPEVYKVTFAVRAGQDFHFELLTDTPGFTARRDFALVVADQRNDDASDDVLYLIGGRNPVTGDIYNDVWFTRDGIVWKTLVAEAEFSPRYGMRAEYYDGKLYVIGGATATSSEVTAQVWVSEL